MLFYVALYLLIGLADAYRIGKKIDNVREGKVIDEEIKKKLEDLESADKDPAVLKVACYLVTFLNVVFWPLFVLGGVVAYFQGK